MPKQTQHRSSSNYEKLIQFSSLSYSQHTQLQCPVAGGQIMLTDTFLTFNPQSSSFSKWAKVLILTMELFLDLSKWINDIKGVPVIANWSFWLYKLSELLYCPSIVSLQNAIFFSPILYLLLLLFWTSFYIC